MISSMKVTEVLKSALYVSDLAAAEKFYTDVLGLEFQSKLEGRHLFLRCGRQMVLLFNANATADTADGANNVPVHGASGAGHLAFAARDHEINQWKEHLGEHGVEIEKEINWGNSRSIYFRDPSQNSLEIASPLLWGIPEETLPT